MKFVALGGEVVVDYALRIKAELDSATWVAGYAHDVMAYIPSRRVLTEGGYEGGGAMVLYGLPCHWGPEIEEVIIKASQRTKVSQIYAGLFCLTRGRRQGDRRAE